VTQNATLRLVGLAQDDPAVPTTGSGAAAKFVLDALARRYDMVGRAGVELTPLQRRLVALATFHPDRVRWRSRFNWHRQLALDLRSRNSSRRVGQVADEFDLVFQVFGLFRTRGAPYVLYVDNTAQLSRRHYPPWVETSERNLQRLYDWERRLYGEARHVFAQGSPHAASVVDFYGVSSERVSVVGGGANFEPLPELGSEDRAPVVLYVGRDWPRKGGDTLIEAFRAVRERVPEATLQIVGTGEAPSGEPGVEVMGTIRDRARIAELYRQCRVFCLPSRYDPYGLSISEAMAYGAPCVVTRVGALDEVVIDGETGLVVPKDDGAALAAALERLLEDAPYAARLGKAGRERVERFLNWDAVVARMAPGLERAALGEP
jgi:glycosyltransferase involved in cell wall biosynthesis